MSWRIMDDGFAMTLTRAVPQAIEGAIGAFLSGDARAAAPAGFAPHPGGAGILDAIERGTVGLDLDPRSLAAGRAVLRDYGNMSSGTVLVVLDRYLASGGALPVDLVAFGPGLTIDAVRLSR
jgi:alkylresorcinol/alkylpyrone synthase